MMTTAPCENLVDYYINVVGDPNGITDPLYGDLYGTYPPLMEHFGVTGLSTIVCPENPTPAENESWGAVKSMYK